MIKAGAIAASLSTEGGVIDTTFLVRELKRNKWIIFRLSITLAGVALLFALKPSYPEVSATLRVDPPSGSGFALGSMHNVDTEIGSLKSYSSIAKALHQAHYYAEVEAVKVSGAPDRSEENTEAYPGLLRFRTLAFPPAMQDREWMIVITGKDSFELQTLKGNVIARGGLGELLTGKAETAQSDKNGFYRLQIDAIAAQEGSRFLVKPHSADALTRKILAKIDVTKRSSSPGSNLLDIDLALADSALAYLVVKNLAEGYIHDSLERQTAAQKEAIARLEISLRDIKADMEQRKQDLLDFYAETNAIEPQIQARNLLQQRLEMEEALKGAQVKLGQLEEIYTGKHPAIRAVMHEIQLLETSLAQLNDHILVLPSQESRLNQLERELNISVDLYQTAIKELARVQLEISRLPQTVHLIDAPRLNEKGRLKYLVQLMIFGGMLGLITGLSLVLLSASMKLGRLYMLPQLRSFTRIAVNQAVLKLRQESLSPRSAQQLAQLIHYHFRESERQLIACCSSTQQRKTANLTIQFAAEIAKRKRTLLVDLHLFASPLSAVMGTAKEKGFSEWMLGSVAAKEVLRESRHSGLWVMPAGEELLNYDLLRDAQSLREKLQNLSEFETIILYLPEPEALPVAAELLECCDRIIHWLELFTTLERLHQYLSWFEELAHPRQNIYVYEVVQKVKKAKARKHAPASQISPKSKGSISGSGGRVFVS